MHVTTLSYSPLRVKIIDWPKEPLSDIVPFAIKDVIVNSNE